MRVGIVGSEHSVASRFVLQEAEVAAEREVLLPVLKQSIRPPMGFRDDPCADLSTWSPDAPASAFDDFLADPGARSWP